MKRKLKEILGGVARSCAAAFALAAALFCTSVMATTINWNSGTIYVASDSAGTTGTTDAYKANSSTRVVKACVYELTSGEYGAMWNEGSNTIKVGYTAESIYETFVGCENTVLGVKTGQASDDSGAADVAQTVNDGSGNHYVMVIYVDNQNDNLNGAKAFVKIAFGKMNVPDSTNVSLNNMINTAGADWTVIGAPSLTFKAMLSADGTTLKLYYDTVNHSAEGEDKAGYMATLGIAPTYSSTLTNVVVDASMTNYTGLTSTKYWFYNCRQLTSIEGLENLDTSNVTNMRYMFSGCKALAALDLSNFNTAKVTNMMGMFRECTSLASLDVSGFNTTNVTAMTYMFNNCTALAELDLSNFDTAKVTEMSHMFGNCTNLVTIYASDKFTTNSVPSGEAVPMFKDCSKLVGGAGTVFDSSKIDSAMAHIDSAADPGYFSVWAAEVGGVKYASIAAAIEAAGGDLDQITVLCGTAVCPKGYAIEGDKLVKVPAFKVMLKNGVMTLYYDIVDHEGDDQSATMAKQANFPSYYSSLTKVVVDASMTNCTTITTMKNWFSNCTKLTEVEGLANLNTSNVTNMYCMFNQCNNLPSLDVSKFDTSKVTDMAYMFYGCSSLASLDVSKFDTSKVTTMRSMFYNCFKLVSLDLSSFDTSKVTNMRYMFYGCKSLASLDLSKFDTSKVTAMDSMFYGCTALASLDVTKFDTSKVTDMSYMFYGCQSLASLDVSSFDTSKVTTMGYMFWGCQSLASLDVTNFDTSKADNIRSMFNSCKSLASLDLTGFDTASATNTASMFASCTNLVTIYASDKFTTNKVEYSNSMFNNCHKLVGGKGTVFDVTKLKAAMAHIDSEADPGYFSVWAAEVGGVKYASIAAAIEAAGGDLDQITVLYGAAECPKGYAIEGDKLVKLPPTCVVNGTPYDTVADAIAAVEADENLSLSDITDIIDGAEIPDSVYLEKGALYYKPVATITAAKQRWPWNGKIDVQVALTKLTADKDYVLKLKLIEGSATNVYTTAFDDLTGVTETNLAVVVDTDSATGWDKQPAAKEYTNPKLQVVIVATQPKLAETDDYAQLWADGPYWAKRNLGADKPEGYGYYYWWGDTVGYKHDGGKWVAADNSGKTIEFSDKDSTANQTYNKSIEELKSAGCLDGDNNLNSEHDAATVALGAPWRMPTDAEWNALISNCTTAWTNNYNNTGVDGKLVTGKGAYSSRSIFLPAAGFGYNSSLYGTGSYGSYLSSTPYSGNSSNAWGLYFDSGKFNRDDFSRSDGQSVRPVRVSAERDDSVPAAEFAGGEFALDRLDTRKDKTLVKTAADGYASAPLAYSKTGWGAVNAPQEPVITVKNYNLDGEYPDDVGVKSYAPAALGSYIFTHTPGNLIATLKWIEKTGVLVNGQDIGETFSGTGWTYDGNALVVTAPGVEFTRSGLSVDEFEAFFADKFVSDPANTYVLSKTATGYGAVALADQIALINGTYYSKFDDAATAARDVSAKALVETRENWFEVAADLDAALALAKAGDQIVLVDNCQVGAELDLGGRWFNSYFDSVIRFNGDLVIDDSVGGGFIEVEIRSGATEKLTIRGGSYNFDPTAYIAADDGYVVVEEQSELHGKVYTVYNNSVVADLKEKYGDVADVNYKKGDEGDPNKIILKLKDDTDHLSICVTNDDTEVIVDLNGKTVASDSATDEGYAIKIAEGTKATIKDSAGGSSVTGERTVGEKGFDLETRPAAIVVEGELVIEGGVYDAEIIVADGAKLKIMGGKFINCHDDLWGTDRPFVSYDGDPNVVLAPGKAWQQGADGYWSLVSVNVFELDGVETTLETLVAKLASETSIGSEAKPVKLLADLRLDEPLKVDPTAMFFLDLNGSTLSCADGTVVVDPGSFFLYDSVVGGTIDGLVDATAGYFAFRGGRFLDVVENSAWDCAFAKRAVRDNEGYWTLADPVDPKKASKDPYERIEDELIPLDEYYGPYVPGVAVAFTNETLVDCAISGLPTGLKFDKKTGAFSGTPTKPGVYKVTFTKTVKDEATKRSVSHKATTTFLVDSLRKVTVVAAGAGQGKATPAEKELAAGKTVALKATAEKGSVFGGWYVKGECVSREANYTYTAGEDAEQLVLAQFIKAKQDVAAAIRVGEVGADGTSMMLDLDEVHQLYVGVPVEYDLKVKANSATKVQVSGLQGGLKFNQKEFRISGVPNSARSFTATIKVTNASKVVSEYGIAFEFMALPDWVVGSFDGAYLVEAVAPDAATNVQGTVTFTVSKTGAVSGKVFANGRTYTFSAKSFDAYDAEADAFRVKVAPKVGKFELGELELVISSTPEGVGVAKGVFAAEELGVARFAHLVQNVWKRTDAIQYDVPTFPTGKNAISLALANGLTAKFAAKGALTITGKLAGDNGKDVSISVTAQLLTGMYDPATGVNAQFVLYVAPKVNFAAGICELVSLKISVDDDNKVTAAEEFIPSPAVPNLVLLTAEMVDALVANPALAAPVSDGEALAFLKSLEATAVGSADAYYVLNGEVSASSIDIRYMSTWSAVEVKGFTRDSGSVKTFINLGLTFYYKPAE